MISIKPDVVTALTNDILLTGLLGGKRVYFCVAPNAAEFPRITYYELSNAVARGADDQEELAKISIVIDIWSKVSTTAIANRVDAVMTSIGFSREFAGDLYEPDDQIHHKHMRYKIIKEVS